MRDMVIGQPVKDLGETGRRDAFHVPAVLVPAAGLRPGDDVRFTDATCTAVVRCSRDQRHGIVDPFVLVEKMGADELVWVLLVPGVAGELRHEFEVRLVARARDETGDEPPPGDDSWVDWSDPASVSDYARCKSEGC